MDDKQAIIWDLDDTLVDTAPLRIMRNARRWSQVYENLHLSAPIPSAMRIVRAAHEKGIPQSIATNSPSAYAQRLVRYHDIPIAAIVAYHDVRGHKPAPDALLLAAKRMGISPHECTYIGNDDIDETAAARAGMSYCSIDNLSMCDSVVDVHVVANETGI